MILSKKQRDKVTRTASKVYQHAMITWDSKIQMEDVDYLIALAYQMGILEGYRRDESITSADKLKLLHEMEDCELIEN